MYTYETFCLLLTLVSVQSNLLLTGSGKEHRVPQLHKVLALLDCRSWRDLLICTWRWKLHLQAVCKLEQNNRDNREQTFYFDRYRYVHYYRRMWYIYCRVIFAHKCKVRWYFPVANKCRFWYSQSTVCIPWEQKCKYNVHVVSLWAIFRVRTT